MTEPVYTSVSNLEAGPELDRQVALKVMGSPRHEWVEGLARGGILGDYEGCRWCERARYIYQRGTRLQEREDEVCVLPYSTDIAAAWKVVDHIHLLSGGVVLTRRWRSEIPGSWVVMEIEQELRHPISEADTAPLAICRAALTLQEEKKP